MSELAYCPFGADHELSVFAGYFSDDSVVHPAVECLTCGATGPEGETIDEAIALCEDHAAHRGADHVRTFDAERI